MDESSFADHINGLCQKVYEDAKAKGFFHHEVRFEDTKPILALLMLIVTEVAEGAEEVRRPEGTQEAFAEELADIVIRVFSMSGAMGIRLGDVIEAKIEKNRQRAARHGGKKA